MLEPHVAESLQEPKRTLPGTIPTDCFVVVCLFKVNYILVMRSILSH